jgi:hypothetical protein
MTTRYLLAVFDSVYVLTVAAMTGGIVFFTFLVEPIIFRMLDEPWRCRFVRAMFPRYYLWNAVLGSIALPAFVAGPLCFPEYRGVGVGIQALILLGAILSMLYGANSLVPQFDRALGAGPVIEEPFARLRRGSWVVNTAVLLAGIGLLVAFACRPAPRTEGIVELSPTERARLEERPLRDGSDRRARDTGRGPTEAPPSPPSGGP